jgi:hypothetical protein
MLRFRTQVPQSDLWVLRFGTDQTDRARPVSATPERHCTLLMAPMRCPCPAALARSPADGHRLRTDRVAPHTKHGRHPWLQLGRRLHTTDTLDISKNGVMSFFALFMTVLPRALLRGANSRPNAQLFWLLHLFERCAVDSPSLIMQVVCLGQASPGLLSAIGKTL